MGFTNSEDLSLFIFDAIRNQEANPEKIFQSIQILNRYKGIEPPLKMNWRDDYQKLVVVEKARTDLTHKIKIGIKNRPYK